jgi:hypothetical protein
MSLCLCAGIGNLATAGNSRPTNKFILSTRARWTLRSTSPGRGALASMEG